MWGISIHAVVVFGLGKDLLFKSVLGHCVLKRYLKLFPRLWYRRCSRRLRPCGEKLSFFLLPPAYKACLTQWDINLSEVASDITFIYRTCAIITRGLYIYHPIFEDNFFESRRFFHKILSLCMVSIQEWFVIKSAGAGYDGVCMVY